MGTENPKRSLFDRLVDLWDYCFNDDKYPLNNKEHKDNIRKMKREITSIEHGEFEGKDPTILSYIASYDRIFIKTAANRIMEQGPTKRDIEFLAKNVGRDFLKDWEEKLKEKISGNGKSPCLALATIPCRSLMVIKSETKP
ncbi:MAG: hypothetical protein PHP03_02360 [Candidatus Pacebacteria bacterium]|nr:hypothetical protein [Candidatus Paceibacterota bacterium]